MNFLSHYYFDRKSSNPYEVLGMVLPDLIKNADKSYNIYPEKNEHIFLGNKHHSALLNGWKRHLQVDKIFHNSPFFFHHQHQIKLLIKNAISDSPVKPFFLGHISLELLLDNLLISEGLIDVENFYKLINEVDEKILKQFISLNGIADTDKFFKFFAMFKNEKYLFSYTNLDKITYALERICMRLWKNPFTKEQADSLTKSLILYKTKLSEEFLTIFELIDSRLN
jgi:acyl carrier protein phosphodiesterase